MIHYTQRFMKRSIDLSLEMFIEDVLSLQEACVIVGEFL